MKSLFYTIFILLTIFSGNNSADKNNDITDMVNECLDESKCDSIYYRDSTIVLCLTKLKTIDNSNVENYIFKAAVYSHDSGMVFCDSVYSKTGSLKFVDYDNDGISDILIQCNSDARSNWTYNLYLVSEDLLIRKVKNFSRIKNPKPLLAGGLIESFVISGENYYQYYQITSDYSVCQFDTIIYDDMDSEPRDWNTKHDSVIRKVVSMECLTKE